MQTGIQNQPITKTYSRANDGASGVGVLLEIARVLKDNKPPIGVDIFFWDIEDYGEPQDAQGQEKEDTWGLGSQYWSKILTNQAIKLNTAYC